MTEAFNMPKSLLKPERMSALWQRPDIPGGLAAIFKTPDRLTEHSKALLWPESALSLPRFTWSLGALHTRCSVLKGHRASKRKEWF